MSRTPQMIQMVIKYSGGLVKNSQQAQYVLVSFVMIAIVVTFVLFVHGGKATPLQADQYRPATAIQ